MIKRYVDLDENNVIKGFYCTNEYTLKQMPKTCIEISEEQYQEALDNDFNFYNKKTKKFSFKDLRTKEEKEEDVLKLQKQEAHDFLNNSDWVITKITEETVLNGKTKEEILSHYSDSLKMTYEEVLTKRTESKQILKRSSK